MMVVFSLEEKPAAVLRRRRARPVAAASASTDEPESRSTLIDKWTTRLRGESLVLRFACFGFFDRDCLVALGQDGSTAFSAGMVSREPGEWRVSIGDLDGGEDPNEAYLEFSQPVSEMYAELYNVPSGLVFWRGRLNEKQSSGNKNGTIIVEVLDGTAISEAKMGASTVANPGALIARLRGAAFQKEGTFSATLASQQSEETLPKPVSFEIIREAAAFAPDLDKLPEESDVDDKLVVTPRGPGAGKKSSKGGAPRIADPTKGFGGGSSPGG